ncbi:hypothetical protein DB771_20085 [Burkholderia sp. AU29985]|nr:hypothetical protein EGY28_01440 [Burkholderia dolosa]PRE55100.1 hypothetical protein C6P87_04945 [Burkholderia sp. AU12872]PUA75099.1 hypothetical protein DB771_20085 [Burkholderia sp. AU29985]
MSTGIGRCATGAESGDRRENAARAYLIRSSVDAATQRRVRRAPYVMCSARRAQNDRAATNPPPPHRTECTARRAAACVARRTAIASAAVHASARTISSNARAERRQL